MPSTHLCEPRNRKFPTEGLLAYLYRTQLLELVQNPHQISDNNSKAMCQKKKKRFCVASVSEVEFLNSEMYSEL